MLGILTALSLASAIVTADAQQRSNRRTTTTPAAAKPAAKPATPKPAPTAKPAPVAKKPPVAAPSVPAPLPPEPKREVEEKLKPMKSVEPAEPALLAPPAAKPEVPTTAPLSANAPTAVVPQAAAPKPVAPLPRTTELFAPPPIDGVTDKNEKYLLRYQFSAGETVRWEVEHKAKIATTVEGTSQTAETLTRSVKAWKVVGTQPGGETTFIHAVESIDMRQKLTGRQETHYNSQTDKDVPPMFKQAATQVGIPLAELTIDTRGKVLKRVDGKTRPEGAVMTDITLVLPDKPLGIGESWSTPIDMTATDKAEATKIIKARRKLTLESVANNIAVLKHETQILSPLNDPAIEAQVVQSEQSGTVRFDLARGRILSIQMTNDREVFGFQGDASVMHVEAAFSERLSDAAAPAPAKAVQAPTPDDKTAVRPEPTTVK
ncbi:MAG: hypothetical protein K8U03_16405 [Planctomycetia bacterium]|nr:hypothetical protein [Planctomycetia bacterium]